MTCLTSLWGLFAGAMAADEHMAEADAKPADAIKVDAKKEEEPVDAGESEPQGREQVALDDTASTVQPVKQRGRVGRVGNIHRHKPEGVRHT